MTANQNPFPENYPYRVSGEFGAAVSFAARFATGCSRARVGSRKTCWACRRMFTPRFRVFWRAQIVAAYDRKHKPAKPELGEAVALLRSWNGQMEKQTPAPL